MNGKAEATLYLLDTTLLTWPWGFCGPPQKSAYQRRAKVMVITQNGTCLECAHCLESFQTGLKSRAGGRMNWVPNWSESTHLGVQETPIFICEQFINLLEIREDYRNDRSTFSSTCPPRLLLGDRARCRSSVLSSINVLVYPGRSQAHYAFSTGRTGAGGTDRYGWTTWSCTYLKSCIIEDM